MLFKILAFGPLILSTTPLPLPRQIVYQPESRLVKIVGTHLQLGPVYGMYFGRPGFDKIWIDAAGAKMGRFSLRPQWLASYKTTLAKFGIDASHATLKPVPAPTSVVPRLRNIVEIIGAKGLPSDPATHQPWSLVYCEAAVANKKKLKEISVQIRHSSKEDRIKLIRSCYDWMSEIDLSKSGVHGVELTSRL